ncbi:MAG: hypothetical protein K6A65_05890 [Succinivibrionaceae bacterium]|nr:hypothetical protein [Succinivibrionaceae bacterium]
MPVDFQLQAGLYAQACAHGSAGGCYLSGQALEAGEDVPQDLKAASAVYGRGCQAGHAPSFLSLGLMAEQGADLGRAAGLYRKACDHGEQEGCTLADRMHGQR